MDNEHDKEHIDTKYEDWWDLNVHFKIREKWLPAVQDYLSFTYMEPSHEIFSPELVKRII